MRCALQALHAGGSTAGGAGLALAYTWPQQNFDRDAVNRVILLTDGDFNVGISDPEKLEDFVAEKRKTGVYLSVYGFGDDNYNDVMMQTLAQTGNGVAGYIDTLDEAPQGVRPGLQRLAVPDRRRREDPGRVQPGARRRVPADRLRDAPAEPRGLQQRPGRRRRGRRRRHRHRPLRDHPGRRPVVRRPAALPARAAARRRAAAASSPSSGPLQAARARAPRELRERPITDADFHPSVEAAPQPLRWAAAVAAYGQLLRGDPYLNTGYGWSDVRALAQSSVGPDPYGLKQEFLRLVGRARDSSARADAGEW